VKIFGIIGKALEAYISYQRWKQITYIHKIEDEIDSLAADGSPSAKLRLERLAKRLKLEQKCIIRSTNSDT
jgi:hypothetical protein